MLFKTCKYCGRVHPYNETCLKKPTPNMAKHLDEPQRKFRSSKAWTKKALAIKKRDNFMCLYCNKVEKKINTTNLEVHHIIPLIEDKTRSLDDDNLITLCKYHHELAESGQIPRGDLFNLVSPT